MYGTIHLLAANPRLLYPINVVETRKKKLKTMDVFVFPIKDMVFYPSSTIPLNVFEPRYIQMIRDAVKTKTPIALVLSPFAEGRDKKKKRQTIAGIGYPEVLETRPDESMVVLLEGAGKVALQGVVQDKPYIRCRAKVLEEKLVLSQANRFRFNRVKKYLFDWLDTNVPDEEYKQVMLSLLTTPQRVLECAAICFIAESKIRQKMLESNDINKKVELVANYL